MKDNQSATRGHNALTYDTVIVGSIVANKDIRIDGKLDGSITCNGKVIVGEGAIIVGDIKAITIELMGTMTGNMEATDNLILKSTSVFEGNIVTSKLGIEPGATLKGQCTMQMPEPAAK